MITDILTPSNFEAPEKTSINDKCAIKSLAKELNNNGHLHHQDLVRYLRCNNKNAALRSLLVEVQQSHVCTICLQKESEISCKVQNPTG